MNGTKIRRLVLLPVAALLALGGANGDLQAQIAKKKLKTPPVAKLEDCCNLKAIDFRRGLITVEHPTGHQTCRFKVNDTSALRALEVGQIVNAKLLPQAEYVPPAAAGRNVRSQSSDCVDGWNGGRNDDTRPKDCIDKATGKRVPCPEPPPKRP